eukprot:scaffold14351_cov388-Ochromonas_danica.AAC.1
MVRVRQPARWGPLSPGLMTLVVGEGQSDKTQCALYTAVTNTLAGYRVLFLDTQNTLSLRGDDYTPSLTSSDLSVNYKNQRVVKVYQRQPSRRS